MICRDIFVLPSSTSDLGPFRSGTGDLYVTQHILEGSDLEFTQIDRVSIDVYIHNSSTQFFLIGFPLFELDREYLFTFSPRVEDGRGAS